MSHYHVENLPCLCFFFSEVAGSRQFVSLLRELLSVELDCLKKAFSISRRLLLIRALGPARLVLTPSCIFENHSPLVAILPGAGAGYLHPSIL